MNINIVENFRVPPYVERPINRASIMMDAYTGFVVDYEPEFEPEALLELAKKVKEYEEQG